MLLQLGTLGGSYTHWEDGQEEVEQHNNRENYFSL